MPDDIYRAGDIQGYDFAFDAAGKFIDWQPVLREVQRRDVRLVLHMGMLFTQRGTEGYNARGTVLIPKDSNERILKGLVYATIRNYVSTVGRKVRASQEEEEEEEEIDVVEEEKLGEYGSMPGTVALLSAVTMT